MQPEYVPFDEVDIQKYVEFMERQITELLTQYGPVAGIWLDGEGVLKRYAKVSGLGLPQVNSVSRAPHSSDLPACSERTDYYDRDVR